MRGKGADPSLKFREEKDWASRTRATRIASSVLSPRRPVFTQFFFPLSSSFFPGARRTDGGIGLRLASCPSGSKKKWGERKRNEAKLGARP